MNNIDSDGHGPIMINTNIGNFGRPTDSNGQYIDSDGHGPIIINAKKIWATTFWLRDVLNFKALGP